MLIFTRMCWCLHPSNRFRKEATLTKQFDPEIVCPKPYLIRPLKRNPEYSASTDLDEIWIGDVSQSSGPRQPIKYQKFKNPRWGSRRLEKSKKTQYLTNRLNDFDEIWHSQASRFSGLLMEEACICYL